MGAVHAALARLDRTKGPGRASLLAKIKEAIREVESDSRIILFGSRARGDASPESDWDLVVIVEGPVDLAREVALWDRLFDMMLDDPSFPVVQALMFDRADWERRLSGPGLAARVTREGIEL
jgi:predicted nucleotidyltransferase